MHLFGRRVRTGAVVVAALALLMLPVASGPVLAAAPHTSLSIGDCYSFTEELPPNKQIRFTQLRANGTQKAARTVNSGGGSIEIECLASFAIGDKLVIRRVNGPVLRTITVPRVTITVDRETNIASGKAPANRPARLLSGPCKPSTPMGNLTCSTGQNQKDFTIPSSGSWSKSATGAGFDPIGGDGVTLFLFTPQGDRITANDRANVTEVQPGSAVVRGVATPGASVTVKFKDGGNVRGTGTATANKTTGAFSLSVRKNGNPVTLALGDLVVASVAADAVFTVKEALALDLSQASSDRILGTCFGNGRFEVSMVNGDDEHSTEGVADTNGVVDVTGFTGQSPITSGVTVQLRCLTPAGDRVLLSSVVP